MAKPSILVRDQSLDFVRGIAILLVIGAHFPFDVRGDRFASALAYPGLKVGWVGVDLFFVLSGFLIGGLLMREAENTGHIEAKRFLARRAFKLLPAYAAYVLLAGFVLVPSRAPEMGPNLLQVQNYMGTPLKHTWSLAVEEHFYLFLTFSLWLMAWRRMLSFQSVLKLCTTIIAFAMLARVVGILFGQSPQSTFHYTHTRIDTLALGIILAALRQFRPETFERLGQHRTELVSVLAGAIAFVFAVPKYSVLMATIGYWIVALGSAAALVLLVCSKPGMGVLGKARATRLYAVVAGLGFYSYGIYLWHRTGYRLFLKVEQELGFSATVDFYVGTVFYVVGGVLAGIMMTKLVELPALALRERFFPAAIPPLRADQAA